MAWDDLNTITVKLMELGYRGETREELLNSVSVEVLCSLVYDMLMRNLEPEQQARVREDLIAVSENRYQERAAKIRRNELAGLISGDSSKEG